MQKVAEATMIWFRLLMRDSPEMKVEYNPSTKSFYAEDGTVVLGRINFASGMFRLRKRSDATPVPERRILGDTIDLTFLQELDLPEMSDREVLYHIADHWWFSDGISMITSDDTGYYDSETGNRLTTFSKQMRVLSPEYILYRNVKSGTYLTHIIAKDLVYNVESAMKYRKVISSERDSYGSSISRLRGGNTNIPFTETEILNDRRPEIKRLYLMYKELDEVVKLITGREIRYGDE